MKTENAFVSTLGGVTAVGGLVVILGAKLAGMDTTEPDGVTVWSASNSLNYIEAGVMVSGAGVFIDWCRKMIEHALGFREEKETPVA